MSVSPESGTAVLLLNFRGAADTLACLDSLLQQDRLFDRLAICDNASPDDSWAALQAGLRAREPVLAATLARGGRPAMAGWQASTRDEIDRLGRPPTAWVTLVDNQGNRGFAAGNNVGLRLLLRDPSIGHFWLLNNDTELQPDALRELQDAAAARPNIGLWGATVVYHDQPDTVQALAGGALNPRTSETRHVGAFLRRAEVPNTDDEVTAVEAQIDYALGACMFANRAWLEQVGLLSEDYFLYYEELDWATRGRAAGLRLGYAHRAVVFHKEGASIGTAPGGGSALSVFHLFRSRLIYCRKFGNGRQLVGAITRAAWQSIKFGLKGRLPLAWAGVRGLTQGVLKRRGVA